MMSKAFEEALKGAEAGDPGLQFIVGSHYQLGFEGMKKDFEKAIYWMTKSADAGFPGAQYYLGTYYFYGKCGLAKDLTKAKHWLSKASAQGHEIDDEDMANLLAE